MTSKILFTFVYIVFLFVYLYLCESKYKINMFTIRKATIDDRSLIHDLASRIWENTYGKILSKEQLDYMFDMMYAPDNILKQMEELHHQYFIIWRTICRQAIYP